MKLSVSVCVLTRRDKQAQYRVINLYLKKKCFNKLSLSLVMFVSFVVVTQRHRWHVEVLWSPKSLATSLHCDYRLHIETSSQTESDAKLNLMTVGTDRSILTSIDFKEIEV